MRATLHMLNILRLLGNINQNLVHCRAHQHTDIYSVMREIIISIALSKALSCWGLCIWIKRTLRSEELREDLSNVRGGAYKTPSATGRRENPRCAKKNCMHFRRMSNALIFYMLEDQSVHVNKRREEFFGAAGMLIEAKSKQ